METSQTKEAKKKFNKEIFRTRLLTATFIGIYYLIVFVFAGIMGWQRQGQTWSWWMPERFIAFLLCFAFIAVIAWLIPKIIQEILNSFLGNYPKWMYYLFLILFSVEVIVPTAFYVFWWYGLLNYGPNPMSSLEVGQIFIITFFALAVLNWIIVFLVGISLKLSGFKLWFLPIIFVFIACSLTWIYYLAIIRTWSTLFFIVLLVAICDSSAYIGGSLLGKHKMSPNISPKKTWEGTIIAIFFTLAIMLLFSYLLSLGNNQYGCQYNLIGVQFNQWLPTWLWWILDVFLILILTITSIFGDLSFSWIKRRLGIKDFGNLLPGHGGILDRLDSITWTVTIYATIMLIICGIFNFENLFPIR